jgi:D-alanyl-D-alanine carboxypeptidase/D-alanyl-D-alanine-endopeptidase (penicillin-binding protein 4)
VTHRPRRLLGLVLAVAALATAGGVLRPPPAGADVGSGVAQVLERHHFAGRSTGVFVWDFDTARTVYASNQGALLAPASNMKLVTSLTALSRWGADYRFKTELYGPGVPVYGGVLYGDLYLKGYGDPSLSTRDYQRREFGFSTSSFESFAKRLRTLKVHKIRGRVLGDESYFDSLRAGALWTPSLMLESGRLSALTGNESLDNGNRVKDPALYAATLLTQALRAKGIKVTGAPGRGEVPETARLLKRQFSAPLKKLLQHMDKYSDNFFAEILTKGLGAAFGGAGTTEAGVDVMKRTLTSIDVPPDAYALYDGSGLSYQNRLTAGDLAKVLGAARQRPDATVFYNALAVAGVDGTLEDRMRGTAAQGNAHAKTGTLNIAVCLSGYVTSANDHAVGFAILINGGSVNWFEATAAQDDVVVLLAKSHLDGRRGARISPWTRQIPASAFDAVNPVGGYLQPLVQP